MFLKAAHEKARSQWSSEEAEFKAKQLHQKAEIAKIDFVETRSDAVLTQVSGQLIRSGIFEDRAFREAIPFTSQAQDAAQSQHGRERPLPDGNPGLQV